MGVKGAQGKRVYLLNPRPDSFDPEDIARALANENRYAGNYGPYSVAQHSVLVSRVIEKSGGYPPQILAGVHHDDTEAVTGDLPEPMKRAMRALASAHSADGTMESDFDYIDGLLTKAIEHRYSIDLDDPIVKWADKVVFFWEVHRRVPADARWMYRTDGIDTKGLVLPYTWFIPWSPDEAFARYMDTHDQTSRFIDAHQPPEEYTNAAS